MSCFDGRYYQARFPELCQHCQGDVDKVAAKVSWEYIHGMQWVLKYYTAGPAAIRWQQQQQQGRDLVDTMSSRAAQQPGSEATSSDDGFRLSADHSLPECNGHRVNLQHNHQQQQRRVVEEGREQQTIASGDCSTTSHADRTKKCSLPASCCAADVDGASWSWCYPYHYAPLMQVSTQCQLVVLDWRFLVLWPRGACLRSRISRCHAHTHIHTLLGVESNADRHSEL